MWKLMTASQKSGVILLIFLCAFAYLQPYFYPMDAGFQNLNQVLQKPSALYWFGTDHFGRDMLSRLASAIRLSFSLIISSVFLALFGGLLLGIWAGYAGGKVDALLRFCCDIIMALPGLLLVLLFAAIAPNSFLALYLGIALVMWVEFFRVIRLLSRSLATSREVEASRLMGMGLFYCIKRHFLPKLAPVILTLSAFSAGNAVLALATLGFINVGLQPPTPELGLMMTELFPYYYEAPWILVQPIIAVFLLVLSFQLISGKVR
ncbi:ABC transporter permease [Conservatibacter flavescens]|uniref:ABC transporter permease n=1 Tax=Conservatibacter flavescens TaxID=28161 RepID=A0A2M8S4D4_9PAST|nr:ABC transporter permease [Conservatibacter flavescens]PJG86003.1 ABC transporter permease [Conservatibacter flavescens]